MVTWSFICSAVVMLWYNSFVTVAVNAKIRTDAGTRLRISTNLAYAVQKSFPL